MTSTHDTAETHGKPADSVRHDPVIVAYAWPTGRPIYPYTPDELAGGVDVYTAVVKARAARITEPGGDDAADR